MCHGEMYNTSAQSCFLDYQQANVSLCNAITSLKYIFAVLHTVKQRHNQVLNGEHLQRVPQHHTSCKFIQTWLRLCKGSTFEECAQEGALHTFPMGGKIQIWVAPCQEVFLFGSKLAKEGKFDFFSLEHVKNYGIFPCFL